MKLPQQVAPSKLPLFLRKADLIDSNKENMPAPLKQNDSLAVSPPIKAPVAGRG